MEGVSPRIDCHCLSIVSQARPNFLDPFKHYLSIGFLCKTSNIYPSAQRKKYETQEIRFESNFVETWNNLC